MKSLKQILIDEEIVQEEETDEAKKQPKWKKKGLVGPGGAWKTAKRQAKKQGQGDNEKYVGAIYKSMTKGKDA